MAFKSGEPKIDSPALIIIVVRAARKSKKYPPAGCIKDVPIERDLQGGRVPLTW